MHPFNTLVPPPPFQRNFPIHPLNTLTSHPLTPPSHHPQSLHQAAVKLRFLQLLRRLDGACQKVSTPPSPSYLTPSYLTPSYLTPPLYYPPPYINPSY